MPPMLQAVLGNRETAAMNSACGPATRKCPAVLPTVLGPETVVAAIEESESLAPITKLAHDKRIAPDRDRWICPSPRRCCLGRKRRRASSDSSDLDFWLGKITRLLVDSNHNVHSELPHSQVPVRSAIVRLLESILRKLILQSIRAFVTRQSENWPREVPDGVRALRTEV